MNVLIVDHADTAGLTAGCRKGQHHRHGQRPLGATLSAVKVPHVSIVENASRHSLSRIDDASAANGYHCVHLFGTGQGDAVIDPAQPGIGHNPIQLYPGNAMGIQISGNPVQQTGGFQESIRAAADQDLFDPILRQSRPHLCFRILAKNKVSRNVILKILQHGHHPFIMCSRSASGVEATASGPALRTSSGSPSP